MRRFKLIKIKDIYIDGYGKFHDTNLDFEVANFVLVCGKNESGKSTVFSFLRTLLAGFNNFRSKENHYFPLNGGKHGGRITLANNNSINEFERYANKKLLLALADSEHSTRLVDQLARIELADYRALFAFDLDELRQLSLLEKDELTEKLFSTGLSGANSLITNCMKDLRDRSLEIFRPRSGSELQESYEDYLLKQENNIKLKTERAEFELVAAEIVELKKQILENEDELSLLQKEANKFTLQAKKLEFIHRKNKYDFDISLLEKQTFPSESDFERESYLHAKKLELTTELKNETEASSGKSEFEIAGLEIALANVIIIENSFVEVSYLTNKLELLRAFDSTQLKNLLICLLSLSIVTIGLLIFYETWSYQIVGLSVLAALVTFVLIFRKITSNKKNIEQTESEINQLLKKQAELASDLGLNQPTNDDLTDYKISTKEKITEIERHLKRLSTINNQLNLNEQEIAKLYQNYNITSRNEFKKLIELNRELKVLTQQRADFIKFVLAQGYDLNKADEVEVSGETHEDIKTKLLELEEINKNLKLLLAKAEVKKDNLLHSTAYEENSLEVSIALDKANNLYADWQSIIFAETVLKEVLSKLYISKYRTVLELSSNFIAEITLGDYQKVVLGQNESELILVGKNGKQFRVEELSRGTVEQLYLAMRIALAISYGEKFGKVPLIFDDILVNFHYERAKAALGLLKKISTTHQIIFFTCHNWIREIFESFSDETTKIIELP